MAAAAERLSAISPRGASWPRQRTRPPPSRGRAGAASLRRGRPCVRLGLGFGLGVHCSLNASLGFGTCLGRRRHRGIFLRLLWLLLLLLLLLLPPRLPPPLLGQCRGSRGQRFAVRPMCHSFALRASCAAAEGGRGVHQLRHAAVLILAGEARGQQGHNRLVDGRELVDLEAWFVREQPTNQRQKSRGAVAVAAEGRGSG